MKGFTFVSLILAASTAISVYGVPVTTDDSGLAARGEDDYDLLAREPWFEDDVEISTRDDDNEIYGRDVEQNIYERIPLLDDDFVLEARAPPKKTAAKPAASSSGVSATAQAAIDWMASATNKAALNAKPLCFYSGYTDVMNTKLKKNVQVTAHGKLATFMAAHGCNSIDNIMSLTGQSSAAKSWKTVPDWTEVSRSLAQHISGTVYVLLGATVPSNSVWLTAEKAALTANAAVTKVEVYEISTTGTFTQKANLKG